MDYLHATVPDGTESNMSAVHLPGEVPAMTFARAVAENLSATLWVEALHLDTGSGMALRLTLRIAGQSVDALMAWRAGRFELFLGGRRDPLRRSGLARYANGLLAALIDRGSASELATLAEHQAAERLAETIAFGGTHAACERAGVDVDDVGYRCAQCGGLDVDAAVGAVPASPRNRCVSCRGVVADAPTPPIRKTARRRTRPTGVQAELLPRPESLTHASGEFDTPARWIVHRALQLVASGRYVRRWGEQTIYVHDPDEPWRPIDGEEARGYALLAAAHLLSSETAFHVQTDDGPREVFRITLNQDGQQLHRRWTGLR
ncbi:hypothetical protein ADK67_14595 [Saccharothrix sp. NRRL B-16348]|uniref:hypothetical protein n=1 Tax=Saccharothrix sp. NRRL B-16348 TaxID=1415542 RepID=UPI0006AFAAFF|nr:hypothetical protein [Saccharothrix sp. NRRL B-16348]KOX27053.1 hypothetical protein ADK67_14595 [Saccharothrix sp. NRRL B-16348]